MNSKEIRTHVSISFINLIILSFITILFIGGISKMFLVLSLFLLGIFNIHCLSKSTNILISPISIFSMIWLILVPLTSGNVPLMDAMSDNQWNYCLIACILFFVGSILSGVINTKKMEKQQTNINKEYKMTKKLFNICILVLIISIGLYFVQAYLSGGFPIFSSNPSKARSVFYTLPGAAFILNLGFLSIYLIYCDKEYRKKKIFWIFSLLYMGIQILMTVRFLLFILIVALLSANSEKKESTRSNKRVYFVIFLTILGFVFISFYRGGLDDKQSFFVETGIYEGNSSELFKTEIIRYFGMSQRTMETYISTYDNPTYLKYTLYPLLDFFGMKPKLNYHYGIYGYTATNIITYFKYDAGKLWWILMIIWSFIMNTWYYSFRVNPTNIINRYFWGISSIGIALSFYCYINSYPYWYFHYIIILGLIKMLNRKNRLYSYVKI